jgi:hypothetical protein
MGIPIPGHPVGVAPKIPYNTGCPTPDTNPHGQPKINAF